MKKPVYFERAIFLSWYCSKGDCKFCYMSTQKDKIKNPKLARRRQESILAEAVLCRFLNWKVEFLSGGYDSYSIDELVEITKKVYQITEQKQWLNIGVLNKEELKQFKPYIQGVCGAVETINPKLHKKLCPSKPIEEIEKMFQAAENLKLKKAITIIIGLGETEKDILPLHNFIRKYKIDKITFYALNPHKGTPFKKGPDTKYYARWIKKTRNSFLNLEIVAGSWVNRLDELSILLNSGADNFTKFPSIKLYGTKYAKIIEEQVKKTKRELKSKMSGQLDFNFKSFITDLPFNKRLNISESLQKYLKKMKKRKV